MGAVESWWAPRSSKPCERWRRAGSGGFDSHPLPPWATASLAVAFLFPIDWTQLYFCFPGLVDRLSCLCYDAPITPLTDGTYAETE